MSNPLPTPTPKQVIDAAASIGIEPQATTTNVNTSAGQTNIPSVVGSQPSSNKPLHPQFQSATVVESVPMEDGFTRPMTEDEILRMPGLEARSFNYSGDEVKVLPVNHNYVLRWVQCGDYRGAGTNWLAKQMARGFEYATPKDLQPEYAEKFKADALGHLVIPPDLVLMKIQARTYYGYLKANMVESMDRISDKGALNRAQKVAASQMRAETLPGDLGKNDTNNNPVKNFNNNLQCDKAAFYDPTAGR
jgi:hypothetical protein